jgi:signal transduction histidine kinase
VTLSRPSATTLVTAVLLVLLPMLAVLQYEWVGQLSEAARERLQRNVHIAAAQFQESLDGEVLRAVLNLQIGPTTAEERGSERYADRYVTWRNTAAHPQIVSNIFLVDAERSQLRLRRWNAESDVLESAEWPTVLARWHEQFEEDLLGFEAGRPPDRRRVLRGEDSLIITPLRNRIARFRLAPGPPTVTPVFGFTVVELNMPYIREQMLPDLASRHFTHVEGDVYRVAVTHAADPGKVLYMSDPEAPVDPELADASLTLFGFGNQPSFFGRVGPPGGPGDVAPSIQEDFGRWRLVVQHQRGSLEAAVASARRRNLGISFGVLLLLTVSVVLLAAASRRAHGLARQQMEFIAGVSHELRTPVAVIRSAAENLSHGIVDGGDRVKRYGQLVETEAKRLGEMVERVLQYAGIESVLGSSARTAVAPEEIVEDAVADSIPLLEPDRVTIERDIAPDLPPVMGDAAALRSAVQNLIANAVKYGGGDGWVGVKAERVSARQHSEVRITVRDHGAGIPASELPHIFEPFYRGADAIARQVHGNGLGLSLVRRIVTAHGGRVTVTSRAGTGSAFTITLPTAEPDPRSDAVAGTLQTTHS